MVMTPERYKQIKSIFQSAVELPRSEQTIFLDKACSGDEGLRREVEDLLSSHGQVKDSIEAIASEAAATMLAGPQSGSLIGRQIGAYQIINQIGRGGMGEVYLARDARLGRQVALKLLPPRFTEDDQRVQRFRQEARAASALNHPNILTIHEIGEVKTAVGALHFVATEFIEGRTLRELIRYGRMKLGEALEVAMQEASELSAAQAGGIVGRALMRAHIMRRPGGHPQALNVALATLGVGSGELGIGNGESGIREQAACLHSPLPTPHSPVSTDPGMVLGTLSYMSPEQARGLETDARSDIFSLGVVLYEMTTLHRPFEGETPSDVIVALLSQEPPFAEHAPDLPGELQRLVSRMLAKDCAGRYQTADEARRALKSLMQDLTPSPDFKTREFSGLARLARRFGRAGASEGYKTVMTTTREPPLSRSSFFFFAGRFTRSPLRGALALMALAALIAAAILGRQWLNRRDSSIDSIAVLPFKPLVVDARDEALELGIADTLITRLSRLQKITVRPFSAVRRFTALDQDPVAAGRQLQAQAVLECNIQKVGDKIRVTARLINVGDGRTLWTQQFDERWSDIFAIQDAISQQVADDLIVTLTGEERSELAKNYTADPEAYRLYMDGSYQWNKRTPEGIRKGLEAFRKAIEKDHGYALAYVGVANAYITLGTYHLATPKEALPLAREAAAQALKIDESLAEAHTAMGKIISDYYWDWPLAEREFKRALKLKPNYPILHDWYSTFLSNMGRFDEAIREAKLELELDPLSPVARTRLGIALYDGRRYDQAITVLQKTLSLEPNFTSARVFLGLCYSMQGRREEALAEFQKGRAIAPNNPDFISLLGNVSAQAGRRDDARRYQQQLNEFAKRAYVSPSAQALLLAGLGDMDAAFMWMEKCFEERCSALSTLKTDPRFDVLRSDARFESLMRRVGFAP